MEVLQSPVIIVGLSIANWSFYSMLDNYNIYKYLILILTSIISAVPIIKDDQAVSPGRANELTINYYKLPGPDLYSVEL